MHSVPKGSQPITKLHNKMRCKFCIPCWIYNNRSKWDPKFLQHNWKRWRHFTNSLPQPC